MVAFIKPGETVARLKTITFELYTSDGLLASGGGDAQYEGTLATSASATLEVRNNPGDAWAAAAGTFAHDANGRFTYVFDNSEVSLSKNTGEVSFRYTKAGFRITTVNVPFYDPEASGVALATAIKAKTDNLPSDPADQSLIMDELRAIGGLLHRNSMADNFTYDPSTGEMLTCRIRVFANGTALAAAVAGHADNTDGEVARYTLTGTLLSGKPASFKARQVLP